MNHGNIQTSNFTKRKSQNLRGTFFYSIITIERCETISDNK